MREDVRFVKVKNSKVLKHRIKFWLSTSQNLNLDSIHISWIEIDISIKWHKNKIGKEQKKQPRKNIEENSLPKYISSKKRNNIVVGYSVHLPNKGTKTFSHSKFTMDEKLQQAIDFLNKNNFNKYE